MNEAILPKMSGHALWSHVGDIFFVYYFAAGHWPFKEPAWSRREEIRIYIANGQVYDLIGGGPWWTKRESSFISRRVYR